MDWIEIPTGRFIMGSDEKFGHPDDDESPAREVTVGAFAISPEPITVDQFTQFIEKTHAKTTAEREGTSFQRTGEGSYELLPDLSWRDSTGPAVSHLSWFDTLEFCDWAHATLPTEAQWERAAHYLGWSRDAWQWCSDFYSPDYHRDAHRVNPTGPTTGLERVLRGGASRIVARFHALPDFSADDIGFRMVRRPKSPTIMIESATTHAAMTWGRSAA